MKKYIEAPEKRTVSDLAGRGYTFYTFHILLVYITQRPFCSCKDFVVSWLVLIVVIAGAQDDTEK